MPLSINNATTQSFCFYKVRSFLITAHVDYPLHIQPDLYWATLCAFLGLLTLDPDGHVTQHLFFIGKQEDKDKLKSLELAAHPIKYVVMSFHMVVEENRGGVSILVLSVAGNAENMERDLQGIP